MARDAIARQYDVDADAVRLDIAKGEVTFRAKKGRLVDLDKLHESIWATRLAVGTGMALNWIDVTAVGEVVVEKDRVVLKVRGSEQVFVLKEDGDARGAFAKLRKAAEGGQTALSVTGRLDEWRGGFMTFLDTVPKKPRVIAVKEFEPVKFEAPVRGK